MTNYFFRRKDIIIILILIVILSVFMQFYFVPKLPSKYFFDAYGVLNVANGNYNPLFFDESYVFTGNFFRFINVFHFTTFNDWAFFITFISLIFCFIYFYNFKKINFVELVLIFLTIALANIYLFRISKDFIQFLFWILMFLFINKNSRNWIAVVFIFVIEGLFFRAYYLAMAALFLLLYYVIVKKKKDENKIFKLIITFIFIAVLGLFILNKFFPSIYNYIINLRILINKDRMNSPDAITMINNIINLGDNAVVFVINYIINFLRMLFPYELIFKGLKYIPFVFYQTIFSIYLIKSSSFCIKNNEKNYYIYLAIIWSYLAIANLFEPDFGSVVRHEITLFPIFMKLFFDFTAKELELNENKKQY